MKVSFFNLTFDKVLTRYYLMMLFVIVPFLMGIPYLAIFAGLIFISAIMGMRFEFKGDKSVIRKNMKPQNDIHSKARA